MADEWGKECPSVEPCSTLSHVNKARVQRYWKKKRSITVCSVMSGWRRAIYINIFGSPSLVPFWSPFLVSFFFCDCLGPFHLLLACFFRLITRQFRAGYRTHPSFSYFSHIPLRATALKPLSAPSTPPSSDMDTTQSLPATLPRVLPACCQVAASLPRCPPPPTRRGPAW